MADRTSLNIPRDLRHRLKCLAAARDESMIQTLVFCLETVEKAQHLTQSLEIVGDLDWVYTQEQLLHNVALRDGGTLLCPRGESPITNWGNYAEFLLAYHALQTHLLPKEAPTYASAMA